MKAKRFLAVILAMLMLTGILPDPVPVIMAASGAASDTAPAALSNVAYAAMATVSPADPTPAPASSSTGGGTEKKKHSHSYKKTKRVEPTCTKAGYQMYKCRGCGKTKKETLKALGHKYGSWKVTKEANCSHTGTKTRKCARCGKTQTETIKKTDHSYGSWTVTKEATCVSTGTRERKCKVCGKKQTDTIGRTDHKYGEWTVTVEPTCIQTGTRERTCAVCGKVQTDTLKMTDHTFGEWVVTVPTTDHSAGTRTRTCKVCGLEETEDFDPDGTLRRGDEGDDVRALQEGLTCYGTLKGYADGDYGAATEKAVRATQEAEGFEADGVAWPQTQNILGHRFGEWETISELSDFSKLERRRVCQRCGYTETEEEWPEPMYKRGDSGDGVKALQQALNDAGYSCGWPDGDFGGNTERAVARIEADHGVEGDGIAWPGVLKWLNLTRTAGEGDEADDEPGEALEPADINDPRNISTFSNPPKTEPKADASDDEEPSILLQNDPVGVVEFGVGDTLDIKLHLTNIGEIPVKLKRVDIGSSESYSQESWMKGTLEPGKTYDFTYHAVMTSNDTMPSSAWREPMVTVIDPVTKHEAHGSAYVVFSRKRTGARISIKPDTSGARKGVLGQDVLIQVHVMNSGDVALENLQFSWLNAKAGDRPLDHVDDYSDESLIHHMEPGKTLTLYYYMRVVDADLGSSAYSSTRKFTASATPANGGASVKDQFSIGFTVVESNSKKVTLEKEEVSARPRPEGYYPGEKIKYRVTIKNGGDRKLELVNFYDSLWDEYGSFAVAKDVDPGKAPWREFEHTVTDEEAQKGYVETAAKAVIEDDVEIWTVESEAVKTPCAKSGDDIDDSEKIKDLELVVIPKDSTLTAVKEGDEIRFTLRLYNNGDEPLTGAFIRAYDGQAGERELYFSDQDPLNPGKYFEAEDKYVVTEQDAAELKMILNWEAFGHKSDGGSLSDDAQLSYDVDHFAVEPDQAKDELTLEVKPNKEGDTFTEGDTIIFRITMTNNGDDALDHPVMIARGGSMTKDRRFGGDTIVPDQTVSADQFYTFTHDDAVKGTAAFEWNGEAEEGEITAEPVKRTFTVLSKDGKKGGEYEWTPPTEPETEPEPPAEVSPANLDSEPVVVDNVSLRLDFVTEMKYPQGYVEGDAIIFNVVVENNGTTRIEDVNIWDSLKGFGEGEQTRKNEIAYPTHSVYGHNSHVVTNEDVKQGYLEIKGRATWKDISGGQHEGETETVKVPLFAANLTIDHTVTGGADQVLHLNDTVEFVLEVKNPSDFGVSTATVYHRLNGVPTAGMGEKVAENATIPAHGSKTFTVKRTVDSDDVARGYIEHSGSVWDGLGYNNAHYAFANPLKVTVSQEGHEDMLLPIEITQTVVGGTEQVLKQDDKYEIKYTVYNPRSVDVTAGKIYASFEGTKNSILVAKDVTIPAHKSVTKTRTYTVTGPDAIRGYIRTKGEVQDGIGTTGIHNTVTDWDKLTVEGNEEADAPLLVSVAIQGGDDQVFHLDDEIVFEITVENTKDFALDKVEIRAQLNGGSMTSLVEKDVAIPAHKSVTKEFRHTVAAEDVVRTYVSLWAFASDGISSGEGHTYKSDSVKAKVGPSGDLQQPITVTKSVKGGEVKEYKEGDVIIFEIAVNNPKSIDLPHVEIIDYPNGTNKGTVLTNSLFVPAHGSNSIEYPYTVTKDDVEKRGYVTNQARAWDGMNKVGGKDQYVHSEVVKVNLDGSPTEYSPLIVTKILKEGWTTVHPGDKLEYEIYVSNPNMTEFTNVTVYDHMNGDPVGTQVYKLESVPSSYYFKSTFKYTVTQEDWKNRGYIDNYATVTWDGQDGEPPRSNTVHLTVTSDAPVVTGQPLTIKKSVVGGGTEFKVNDSITYQFYLFNPNSEPVTGVKVFDHQNGDPTGVLVQGGITIPANDHYGTAYTYTVTGEDATRGWIEDYGSVTWDGQVGEDPTSNTVHVTIAGEGEVKPLEVVKQVKDGADGFYKDQGIVYEITIKNPNDIPAENVTVYDHMNGDATGSVLFSGLTIPANDEVFRTFTHIVDANDVERTYITNYARAHWDGQAGIDPVSTEVLVHILKDPEGAHALKVTKAVQGGTTFHVNDVITYAYTISNPTDEPQKAVKVYDHMNDAMLGTEVDSNITVPAHDSVTRTFTYTVKPEDLTRGWIEDYVRLDVGSDDGPDPTSNTVHVDIVGDDDDDNGGDQISGASVSLFKWVTGKTYYVESEVVPFQVRVENHTGAAITNVTITDPLSSAPGKVIATYMSIPDGGGDTIPFPYTVTHFDATVTGVITNTAKVTYTDAGGQEHTVPSAPVTVYASAGGGDSTPNRAITATVVKEVSGKPKNGKFYQEGEPIHYVIHVTYTGYGDAPEIIVTDPLKAGSEVGRVKNVPSGYAGDFTFDYTVTGLDVDHTKVVNTATIYVWLYSAPEPLVIDSNPVTSPTGREKTPDDRDGSDPDPDAPNEPGETPASEPDEPEATPVPVELSLNLADSCVRTLIGKGEGAREYAQTYCPEHARIADAVKALLDEAEEAGTDEARLEAWQQAVALWTDAVNEEYGEWLERALDAEKPYIEEAQTAFFDQLAAHEDALKQAYPDDPDIVAMKVSEQLMNQCVELCYEAHTAPSARADSLGNGLWEPIEAPEAEEQCVREVEPMDVGAKYLENLCERHRSAEAAVDALLEDVETDEELAQAWQDAKQLWLTELDALTNERYLAADSAGRDAIAAERVSFGSWLNALENTLTLAYPDQPQIVNEVMAGTIRSRVLDLCTEEQK